MAPGAGTLLLLGAAVFFGLGFGALPIWRDGRPRRRWLAAVFVAAAACNVGGLVALTLAGPDGSPWFPLAAGLALAAIPPLAAAMRRYAASRGPPEADLRATRWVRGHMVLAFTAMACAGAGLLGAGLAPPWAGWSALGLGAFLAASMPLALVLRFWVADLPLWVHVGGALIGAGLLMGP